MRINKNTPSYVIDQYLLRRKDTFLSTPPSPRDVKFSERTSNYCLLRRRKQASLTSSKEKTYLCVHGEQIVLPEARIVVFATAKLLSCSQKDRAVITLLLFPARPPPPLPRGPSNPSHHQQSRIQKQHDFPTKPRPDHDHARTPTIPRLPFVVDIRQLVQSRGLCPALGRSLAQFPARGWRLLTLMIMAMLLMAERRRG